MLAYDPKERATLKQVMNHPWVLKEVPSGEEMKAECE